MFLNFTRVIHSEAGIFHCSFLIFRDFDSRCSYKIVLMKKRVYTNFKIYVFGSRIEEKSLNSDIPDL